MPTRAEQDELLDNCTWTWTTQNGVKGYKVTSKTNGNSIFLPAAGYRYGTSVRNVGSGGYYWLSSLDGSYPHGVYYFTSSRAMWAGTATIATTVARFALSARSPREAERQIAGRFAGINLI